MGGFSASAMNTAAARARSSQSRPGSGYSRACPNADTENRSPRSVTFGTSLPVGFVSVPTADPSATATASALGHFPVTSTVRLGAAAATSPSRSALMPTDFRPTPSSLGVSYP